MRWGLLVLCIVGCATVKGATTGSRPENVVVVYEAYQNGGEIVDSGSLQDLSKTVIASARKAAGVSFKIKTSANVYSELPDDCISKGFDKALTGDMQSCEVFLTKKMKARYGIGSRVDKKGDIITGIFNIRGNDGEYVSDIKISIDDGNMFSLIQKVNIELPIALSDAINSTTTATLSPAATSVIENALSAHILTLTKQATSYDEIVRKQQANIESNDQVITSQQDHIEFLKKEKNRLTNQALDDSNAIMKAAEKKAAESREYEAAAYSRANVANRRADDIIRDAEARANVILADAKIRADRDIRDAQEIAANLQAEARKLQPVSSSWYERKETSPAKKDDGISLEKAPIYVGVSIVAAVFSGIIAYGASSCGGPAGCFN